MNNNGDKINTYVYYTTLLSGNIPRKLSTFNSKHVIKLYTGVNHGWIPFPNEARSNIRSEVISWLNQH